MRPCGLISAANIAHLAGTTINTPGTLTLSAPEGKFYLDGQQIETTTSHQSTQSDAMYQKARGNGGTDQHTEYNQFNAAKIVYDTPEVRVQLGSKDSAAQLASQPGMAWVGQQANDPAVASRVKWDTLEDASRHWQYKQQGLTPAGAAVVTAVIAYFTAGMGNGIAVGMGLTTTVGGTTLTAAGTVVAGMTGAAITTLATQAAIAIAAHPDDLGAALDELGSSANVKSLVSAILTGGVLSAMNMNPDGLPSVAGGAQTFTTQLLENLKVGMARAVIDTAIQGGSLEERLNGNLYNAFIDTITAQSANAIGDMTQNGSLNEFTNKIAHAIAGCAAGALRQEANCSAGAIGAMVGEMAAEWYGNRPDTVQFSSMMASMAAAVAGEDAAGIALAGQAGANAAANNYLNHQQKQAFKDALLACHGDTSCIREETRKWKDIESSQSADANTCQDGRLCAEISREARSGWGFKEDEVATMCAGEPSCIDFASQLERKNSNDSFVANDRANSIPVAKGIDHLKDRGIDPDTAQIIGSVSPADLLGAGIAIGGSVNKGGAPNSAGKTTGPIYKTTAEATAAAESLGYNKVNETVNGQAIYKKGNSYITRDVDSHNGGAWKMADSIENLGSKKTRTGTFDGNLNKVGD